MPSRALAVLLLATALAVTGCGPDPKPANVLLILVDTLRKDRLHLYGYERRTSDRLDVLARDGWVFENHIAPASQTVPSTLSLMVGLLPAEHGFPHRSKRWFAENCPVYPDRLLFLAEVFQEGGYRTAGFVSNPFLSEKNNFHQGFDTFEHFKGKRMGQAEKIADAAVAWLDHRDRNGTSPFFMYLHFMDVHQPYEHPAPYMNRFSLPRGGSLIRHNGPVEEIDPLDFEYTSSAYDAGIAWVDDQIARVIDRLETAGLEKETLIVLTSDHGEEFLEHGGMGHGTSVYGELVRVPLIMVYPNVLEPGVRIRHLTQHIDLGRTILTLAGVNDPPSLQGRNLLREPATAAVTEDGPWRAVYTEGHKLVVNLSSGTSALFDARDELDQQPLDHPPVARRLRKHLDGYLALERSRAAETGGEASSGDTWTEEELEQLRNLGYTR